MKTLPFGEAWVFFVSLLLLLAPTLATAQTGQKEQGPPPVGAPSVREGDFAVSLAAALSVVTTEDEVEAESRLGDTGVVPRNGWIADYPVTPDIIGELQKAVGAAADARKLAMSRDEALNRLHDVAAELGVPVIPSTRSVAQAQPEAAENYPNPTDINDYYDSEGPPVVTYYPPPPDYDALYAFIPYPFRCYGFRFPGFFILHDFHRTIVSHNRVRFVSNHFNDVRVHRVFRIDPVARFNGRTFAGIGAPRTGAFISTGIRKSSTRIFNAPPAHLPSSQMVSPSSGRRSVEPLPSGGSRVTGPPVTSEFTIRGGGAAVPSGGGRAPTSPPSRGGVSPPSSGGISAPSGGSVSAPSPSGGFGAPSSGGFGAPSSGGVSGPSPSGGFGAPSSGGISGPSRGGGGFSGGGRGGGGHGR